jgi:endonuclease/exonuclease/phosphatase family metal-dependent hydrolase
LSDDFDLTVMTYNIQQGSYYIADVTPEEVSKIVLKHDVDLLGTQELHMDGADSLATYLPDYNWFGVGRDDGEEQGETGVIFYKKDRFELLEESTFWLSETPTVPGSKSWNSSDTRMVTWGKFKLIDSDEILFLFNTHFDHKSSWAREESSKLTLEKIKEIAGKNHPVIITGDFNFTSSSEAYQILVDDYYNYLKIYDTYYKAVNGNTGPTGTYNGYSNNNPTNKIDFVFVNPFFDVLSNEVITDKREDGEYISDHFPVKSILKMKYPNKPVTPTLKAIASDNKVMLTWDNKSELETLDTFADTTNDFQGYKLYKSKTPDMADALLIEDKWDVPMLRIPLFECDLIDDISGYTNYGINDGFGYYLGSNNGLQHFYVDNDVTNDETYYYILVAHDHGISGNTKGMADGMAPLECKTVLNTDGSGNIINSTTNVAIAKPVKLDGSTPHPGITLGENETFGKGTFNINLIDPDKVVDDNYRVVFVVDTVDLHAETNSKYRSERDIYYVNSGCKVISENRNEVIYEESIENYTATNILFNEAENYYFLNNLQKVATDEFEGVQIELSNLSEYSSWDSVNSTWLNGNSDIVVKPSINQSKFFPYDYEIIFGENYTSKVSTSRGVYDVDHEFVGNRYLVLNQTFDFKVVNKTYNDEELDIVGFDSDNDETFDILKDQVFVGYSQTIGNKTYWSGTVFSISFQNVGDNYPEAGDVYKVTFKRPFCETDELTFSVNSSVVKVEELKDNLLNETFQLNQNYPNPFNPTTNIPFQVFKEGRYSLKIYNALGQVVQNIFNKNLSAGSYVEIFDGNNLSSGVYIYALKGEGKNVVRKMMLVK